MDKYSTTTLIVSKEEVQLAIQQAVDKVLGSTFISPWLNEKKVLELFGYTNRQHLRGVARAKNIRISKPIKAYLYWRDDVFKFIENGVINENSIENQEL